MIHTHLSEDSRHGNRMVNIGFASFAGLSVVRFGTKKISPINLSDLIGL